MTRYWAVPDSSSGPEFREHIHGKPDGFSLVMLALPAQRENAEAGSGFAVDVWPRVEPS